METKKPILHSAAICPSSWIKKFNQSDVDIIHLHWICNEMMSIKDIGRIRKPMVWTMHDMWPFCGAEHYTEDNRWREGYTNKNRPTYESGLDLNRWVWGRKRKAWKKPMHVVAPSRWLAKCARQSVLMRDWPISVIHNAIDTTIWRPIEQSLARDLMHLPNDTPLLAFGAMGGGEDPRKGFDLLLKALKHLYGRIPDLQLVLFGQLPPREKPNIVFPMHYTGQLHDNLTLQVLYNAVDAMVIPSRQDNLPNTGVEALACGTPVVAFDACGLPDIVDHQRTGYLASAFDPEDLANGIQWVIEHQHSARLREAARASAIEKFDNQVVAKHHIRLYEEILK